MKIFFITSLLLLINIYFLSGQKIYTVVGNGKTGFKDLVPAQKAELNYPTGVSVDNKGNIYIADCVNNRIRVVRKIEGDDFYRKSVIKTIAGTGTYGYNGTGSLGIKLSLAWPKSVFPVTIKNKFGEYNEVYFSDSKNNIIRKIDKKGFLRRVAGNLKAGFSGDEGPATKAALNEPNGIFIDKNKNIYIADTINNRVRVVYNNGKIAGLNIKKPVKGYIYTIAGNGANGAGGDRGLSVNAHVGEPYDVTVDKAGNVYIAQRTGSIVRKIDIKTGKIYTIAGIPNKVGYSGDNSIAVNEKLNQPFGVWVDLNNNIFIADGNNMRIRKVDNEGYMHSIAGNGRVGYKGDGAPSKNSYLSFPLDVFGDNKGTLFIADSINAVIRMIK